MVDELVTIARFEFPVDAEAARMHLEDEGIPAFIADGEIVNQNWLLSNAVGFVKLQVPADRASEALSALKKRPGHTDPGEIAGTGIEEAGACLACGAKLPTDRSTCPACGWSYSEAAEPSLSEPRASLDEEEQDDEEDTPGGGLSALRSWKRPIFWLILSPPILGIVAVAYAILSALLGLLLNRGS